MEVVAASGRSLLWLWTGVGVTAGPVIAYLDQQPVLAVTAVTGSVGSFTTVWLYWWWGRNAILATEEGLMIRTRGQETLAYRWSEIGGATWSDGSWGWVVWPSSAGVLVSPSGDPHAVPGPNSPVQVGAVAPALPWRRRAAASHATDVLRRYLGDRVDP